ALTVNGPPVGPATVPPDVPPSPHWIVAVKSAIVPFGLASVSVATGPLNACGDTAAAEQTAAIGASTGPAVPVADVVLPPSSTTVTFTVYEPSSVYTWLPV